MKKHNILVTVNGVSKSRAQWAKEIGVTKGAISFRESKGESASSAISEIIGTVHNRKILEHYAHAKKKHPHFCDRLTCLSKTGANTHVELLKATLESAKRVGDVEAVDVALCKLHEAVQSYTHGDNAAAVEELYDTIAVILRTIDVIKGRQAIGKPLTKQSKKKGTK